VGVLVLNLDDTQFYVHQISTQQVEMLLDVQTLYVQRDAHWKKIKQDKRDNQA